MLRKSLEPIKKAGRLTTKATTKALRAAVVVALIATGTGAQVLKVPDLVLEVGYRQRENGKLSEAVFQDYLECRARECTLTTLTLNQCVGGAFYPKLQHWSTRDKSLSVSLIAPDTVFLQYNLDGARFQARYVSHQPGKPYLKSYSGAVTKNSAVLGKVIAWELVPIKVGEYVRLQCPVALDGVSQY